MTQPTTTAPAQKLAFLYARFSSRKQRDGDSIQRQQQAAEKYCAANNLMLSDISFFDLGVSGYSKKARQRPMFNELLLSLEQGKIPAHSTLLFESTDRISREPWPQTQRMIMNIVMQFDITLVIIDKGQIFNKQNCLDITNNVLLMFNADMAAAESRRKSDLVSAAYTRKRERGEISRLPFWLSLDNNNQPVFNDKLEIIRLIVELRLQGLGSLGIASELNRRGYKSPRGGIWRHTSVSLTLKNPMLYGTKQWITTKTKQGFDGTDFIHEKQYTPVGITADAVPAVIDFDTFQKIQINGIKPMRRGADSPFAGLIKCVCGGTLSVYHNDGHVYRKCSNARYGACKFTPIRGFDELLTQCLSNMEYKTETKGVVSRIPEYQDRLSKLEQVKAALLTSGAVDALTDIYTDIANIKSLIEQEQKQQVSLPDIRIGKIFELESNDEIRMALVQRIESITVERNQERNHRCSITVQLRNGHRRMFFCDIGVGRGNAGKNRIDMYQILT